MTASVTASPRKSSAVFFILRSTSALIWGSQLLVTHLYPGVAVVGLDDLEGHQVDVLLHLGFGELAADQALGSVNGVLGVGDGLALGGCAHQDFAVFLIGDDGGVVRAPSLFSITRVLLPSMMATQLLVVPRSIPMIFPIILSVIC